MSRPWPERALLQMLLHHLAGLRPQSPMKAKLFLALSLAKHDWPPTPRLRGHLLKVGRNGTAAVLSTYLVPTPSL